MKIKELFITLLLLISLSACGDSSAGNVVFESKIKIIVDGKYIELKKRYACKAETFTKAGGDKFYHIKQIGYAVSHELPTGEYIIASIPWACNRFGVDKRDENGKAISYKINRPLPDNFLPFISIADKGPVPDRVIAYTSNLAYKAKASRIEFRGVSLDIAPKGSKPSKKDEFSWFLSEGGGNGPYYHSFILRRSVMFPELRHILDKHLGDATKPVRLHNKRWVAKYDEIRKFWQGRRVDEKKFDSMNNSMHYQMFPDIRSTSSKYGANANPSPFDHGVTSFSLKENTDFSDDTLELIWDKDYEGMNIYHRMPYEHFQHAGATLASNKNLKYILPEGGIYYHHAGDNIRHVLYNSTDKNLYRIGIGRNLTSTLKGWGMDKYNYKTIRKK